MTQDISRKSFLQLGAGLAAAVSAASPVLAQEKKAEPRPKSDGRTLIRNVDVLTMQADHSELMGMDVMLAEGKIAAIAKSIPAGDAEVVDGTGRILMPGLVDSCRQAWQSLDIGRLLELNRGFLSYYSYVMKLPPAMTPEDRYLSEYLGAVLGLNSGFTTMIDCGYAGPFEHVDQACAGFKASGINGIYCHPVASATGGLPDEQAFEDAKRLRDKHFNGDGDVRFGLMMGPCWGATYADAKTYYNRLRALKPQILLNFHHNYGGGTGPGGAARGAPPLPEGTIRTNADMRDQGLLGPDMHLVHATELTDEELKFLAAAGVTFGSSVLSEFTYPDGLVSIFARAQAAGAPASVCVDVPCSESPDPFAMVRAAFALLYKTPENRKIADTLASDDTLAWITREAAKCARMGDQAGAVTVGKRADVILLDTDRIGFPVVGTLADRVANFGLLSDVDSVWVSGVVRKRDGEMVGIDMKALKAKAVAHQDRIWRALGSPVFGNRG